MDKKRKRKATRSAKTSASTPIPSNSTSCKQVAIPKTSGHPISDAIGHLMD